MTQLNSYTIGKSAENKALIYLKNLDWNIVDNNYKTQYGEIDILAKKDKTLVAFEVKTRKNKYSLYYSIGQKQQKRIINALLFFLSNNQQYTNYILRFDALLINNTTINHIVNAWSYYE